MRMRRRTNSKWLNSFTHAQVIAVTFRPRFTQPRFSVYRVSSSSVNLICFGPTVREASPHKRTHIDAIFLGRHQRQRNDPYRGKQKSSLWRPKKMEDDSWQRTQTQLPNGKTYALSPPTNILRRGPSKNWFEKLQLLLYNAHSSLIIGNMNCEQ